MLLSSCEIPSGACDLVFVTTLRLKRKPLYFRTLFASKYLDLPVFSELAKRFYIEKRRAKLALGMRKSLLRVKNAANVWNNTLLEQL